MLSILRKHAASSMIKIILGLIVIVFIFWGFEGFRAQRSGRVALVNGETITIDQYRVVYNNIVESYREQYKDQFTQEMLDQLEPGKRALDTLINQKVIEMEAKRLGFQVTDQELADVIATIGYFQRNGVFDSTLYNQVLQLNRLTPEVFEEQRRSALMIEKLRQFVSSNIKVSDAEAFEYFQWDNTSVKIKTAKISSPDFEVAEPEPGELETWFEKNREDFRVKPQRRVSYVHVNPKDYADKIEVPEASIAEYYNANPAEFKEEKTVEARHILIKVDNDAEESVVEEKKKQILEVLKKARAGEDFAELAKQYSEGPTKDRGGDLGAFTREAMVKPFADAAFSMKPGEISEPVRTQFGWHLIKVEKVNEERTLTLEQATEQIKRKLSEKESDATASAIAEKISDAALVSDDLVKAAEKEGVELKTTDLFTEEGPKDRNFLTRNQFTKIAFSLEDGEISQINKLSDGYYILQLTEQKDSYLPEFEEKKEIVRSRWEDYEREQAASEAAKTFLERLNSGETMEDISGEIKATILETDFFKRNQAIPKVGFEPNLSVAAFQLSGEKKFPEEPVKTQNGFYVFSFLESKKPGAEDFEKEKENVRSMLLRRKQVRVFDDWVKEVRKNSEILIEKDFV